MKYAHIVAISALFCLSVSCKKDKQMEPFPAIPVPGVVINVSYKVDSSSFMTNCFSYTTAAGNNYSIEKFVYYLSVIKLIKPDSSCVLLKDYHYLDATLTETNQLILKGIPKGNYIGITFNIGLDSLHNKPGALPVIPENINMIWPEMMGGGYHFIKLEGHFKDPSGTSFGYAMHLGTNACFIPVKLFKNITVLESANTSIDLVMNINEWFRNPYTYDFNSDGNYIMGDTTAMKKIADNGIDVFSL